MYLVTLTSLLSALAVASSQDLGTYPPPETSFFSGHINPDQVNTFVYVPFTVPPHVTSIHVEQDFSDKNNNSLHLGIFDQRGYDPLTSANGTNGFRGWSGWFRSNFTVAHANGLTTPSYIGGPITEGEWNVVLGPLSVIEDGLNWNLTVTLDYQPVPEASFYRPAYADVALPFSEDLLGMQQNSSYGEVWLRGDFHVHSVYSDGRYLPEQQIDIAIAQELDFFFFTEHNTYSGHAAMGVYQPRDSDKPLLIGRGSEVTTAYGHWQALGLEREQVIEWRYSPDDTPGYAEAVRQVHASGGFASINHPYANFTSGEWEYDDWESNDAIEVWNGEIAQELNERAIARWRELLAEGKRVTGIGGSDSHNAPSLVGHPTTVVRSRSLSQADIVYGVKAGLAYIVEAPGMEMSLYVRSPGAHMAYTMGDKVPRHGRQGAIVELSTTGLEGLEARFFSSNGNWRNQTISEDGLASVLAPETGNFVMVEIRNSTYHIIALSNAIYFE